MFRHFDVTVGRNCQQIEEFKIGSKIKFHDECTGESGEGIIECFCQSGYRPTIWYRDSSGKLDMAFLGWCKLVE